MSSMILRCDEFRVIEFDTSRASMRRITRVISMSLHLEGLTPKALADKVNDANPGATISTRTTSRYSDRETSLSKPNDSVLRRIAPFIRVATAIDNRSVTFGSGYYGDEPDGWRKLKAFSNSNLTDEEAVSGQFLDG